MPEIMGGGGAFLDYDNDGDVDIYLIQAGPHTEGTDPKPNRLFRQEADGTFSDVTTESGLGDTGYGMGVAVGDIDNDGYVDVYVSNYGPDALYRNDGRGGFEDISSRREFRERAGPHRPLFATTTTTVTWICTSPTTFPMIQARNVDIGTAVSITVARR